MSEIVIGGTYRHYKGLLVTVMGVAKHSETLEELVVYSHSNMQTGENQMWARPKDMFLDMVEKEGKKFSRFELIS